MKDVPEPDLSIGDVADATGLSVDTIRVWERRYGRPVPVRLPSGHRRYGEQDVRWLRRVAEALALGNRPSKVVKLSDRELDELLLPPTGSEVEEPDLSHLLALVMGYQGQRLIKTLLEEAGELGPRRFLNERVTPLITAVGRGWADGTLMVRHEHLLSNVLEDVLRQLRNDAPKGERTSAVVLTTLSGETHGIGLQMAGLVVTLAGCRPVIVGTNTPNEEIAAAAAECGAKAVLVSVSLATGGVKTDRVLSELRGLLPAGVRLMIGGRGARGVRRGPKGVEYLTSFPELEDWLRELA